MDDLIKRQEALDALLQCRKHCIDPFDSYHIDIEDAEARIRRVPSAQPKKGRWLNHLGLPLSDFCSVCAKDSPYNKHWDFCPNCGADMRGSIRK